MLGSESGVPAAVLTVQTAGEALNFHPHLHGCLANGLFAPDGTFLPFDEIDQEKLPARFGERVLAALLSRELVTDNDVAQILSQQHSGFHVWMGEPFLDAESERFVARYIERGPLSLEKLSVKAGNVIYTTKDGTAHEFDGLEFLALLSSHIAKPYESLTRYYGWYSCRARGERKKLQPAALADETNEPLPKASSTWAACIKRIFELDPLECPKCKGIMRVIAFIHDPREISKISRALKIPDFQPPAKLARAPPAEFDVYHDDADLT